MTKQNMKTREAVLAVTQLRESYDSTKGVLTVRVIESGFNKSRERYYPTDTLKRDYRVFEGVKMFADHQTDAEALQRPEGSVHGWVATLNKVWAVNEGNKTVILGEAVVIDPAFKAKLEALSRAGQLSKMGVSIRAVGEASTQEIEGHTTKVIESFLSARSVDFVTYAGAGGRVEAIESSTEPVILEGVDDSGLEDADDRRRRIVESWMSLGLSEGEARIAAGVEESYTAEAIVDWAKVQIGGSR